MELTSKNEAWLKEIVKLRAVSLTDCSVLLTGETGCGKDYIANKIHEESLRREGNFVAVNCAAITDSLLESELFGHKRGAFTGALDHRAGAFKTANKGTLFLDEIGDMPLLMQAKLLRVLENQEVKPVGSDTAEKISVRIIAATHQDLRKLVREGKFRLDLFYRINVVNVKVPPLRERLEDFEDILYCFARTERVAFSYRALQSLKKHWWPGNIRELRNVVTKGGALFRTREIESADVVELLDVEEEKISANEQNTMMPPIKEIEREMIVRALEETRGNQRRAAHILRIPKSTLHDKIKDYGLQTKINERPRNSRGAESGLGVVK